MFYDTFIKRQDIEKLVQNAQTKTTQLVKTTNMLASRSFQSFKKWKIKIKKKKEKKEKVRKHKNSSTRITSSREPYRFLAKDEVAESATSAFCVLFFYSSLTSRCSLILPSHESFIQVMSDFL